MPQKNSSFESWLDRVRHGSPAAQRFWLYGLTSVTMAIVVVLWSGYMSLEMPSVAPVNQKVNAGPVARNAALEENLNIGSGLALVARALGIGVSRSMAYVKDIVKNKLLGSEETIIVKPKKIDFVVEDLPNLEMQKLPMAE